MEGRDECAVARVNEAAVQYVIFRDRGGGTARQIPKNTVEVSNCSETAFIGDFRHCEFVFTVDERDCLFRPHIVEICGKGNSCRLFKIAGKIRRAYVHKGNAFFKIILVAFIGDVFQ